MKHEKSNGLLRRAGSLFVRNFGLKLLSLALAVLIYEVLKPAAGPSGQPLTVRTEGPGRSPSEPAKTSAAPSVQTGQEAPVQTEAARPKSDAKPAETRTTATTTRTNKIPNNGKSRK